MSILKNGAAAALIVFSVAPASAQDTQEYSFGQLNEVSFHGTSPVSLSTPVNVSQEVAAGDNHRMFYVMPKVGTLGYGADVSFKPHDAVGVRALWRTYDQDFDFDVEGEQLDAAVDLGGYGAVLDLYPTRGNFRMSGGVYSLKNNVDLNTTIESTIDVNGTPVQAEADVEGEIDYDTNAPFLSIGWHDYLGDHVSYDISLGAVYQGQPDVTLRSTGGTAAGQPDVEQEIDDIEREIEDTLGDFNFYPVVEFGVTIHF